MTTGLVLGEHAALELTSSEVEDGVCRRGIRRFVTVSCQREACEKKVRLIGAPTPVIITA